MFFLLYLKCLIVNVNLIKMFYILQPTETMIQAYHRLDDEILSIENSSPGARLTTAEAWVEHLETMHLSVDDNVSILINDSSESVHDDLDESVLVDSKVISAVSREKSDIVKVKKVCVHVIS